MGGGALTHLLEERLDRVALVALELEHHPHGVVLDHGAVAALLLLDGLEDFLEVELLVEALDRRDALSPVALLHADMHQVGVLLGELAIVGVVLFLRRLLLLLLLGVIYV